MKKKILLVLSVCALLVGCNSTNEQGKESGSNSGSYDSTVSEGSQSHENPTYQKGKNKTPLTMAVVGDIMMGTTVPKGNLTADDGANLFKDCESILQVVDIAAGNLEGALFDGTGVPKPGAFSGNVFAFKMPSRYVNHLVKAGFDFVSIANNHVNDFGVEALDSTMSTLDKANIAYAGHATKCPTTIIEKDGRVIGFAAFGFSQNMPSINDYATLESTVKDLKKKSDIVVVSFHGGGEGKNFQHVPHKREHAFGQDRGNVEEFAHKAVDAGADVVYGHSPHVTRALELYKDRLIVYSLGNFCTPYRFNISGVSGYAPIVEMTLNGDGSFVEGQIHSFIQTKGVGPRTDSANRVAKTMSSLTKSDFPNTPLAISDNGKIMRK